MPTKIKSTFTRFARDESGAALLEYSLLIGIIAGGAVAIIYGVSGWVDTQWDLLKNDLNSTATSITGKPAK